MRGLILKHLNLGGNGRKLSRNVIYDTGNVDRLSKHLYALRTGALTREDEGYTVDDMETMIEKYSTFEKHVPGSISAAEGHVVILTGSTGSLGAHLLALLLTRSEVRKVYCLVRGANPRERVLEALQQRDLMVPDTARLVTLTSDLSRGDLGLSLEVLNELRSEVTTIIHRYVSSTCSLPSRLGKRCAFVS